MVATRLALLLVLGGSLGVAAQTPAAPAPPKQAPPPSTPAQDLERVAKLRSLVEAAEKALDAEDEETAYDRADEAEVLVADWDQTLLERPDVQILLERLKGVQNQVTQSAPAGQDTMEPTEAQEPPAGLKEPGQVTVLKGSDLTRELARVQAAEQGATYDFPIDLNDKVLTWIRLFTTEKRGYIERTLARGAAYFPMIRQVFAEEGIPQDLAYLGVVESGYINQARSHARAVGMWQFMPSTGRLFGLKINRWLDERRDPVKSTQAAARYLKRLYDTSGDWYLALVGYNAGPLTTQKAQTNLGSSNFWDMYRSPYLRNQTKNYVPELCAAILIARNPERYGFQADSEPPFVYETVEVHKATSLRTIARYAGVSEGTIKGLNPQLLRGTTPPGSYEVRVPVGTALEAQRRLGGGSPRRTANLPVYVPKGQAASDPLPAVPTIPEGKPLKTGDAATPASSPATYTARPGDTLAKIARARGLSLSDLMRLNPEAVKHLAVGDEVRLPDGASHAAAPVPQPPTPKYHTVRRGETLTAIAARYGLEIQDLKTWNRLRSGHIRSGQRLRLVPR